MAKPGSPKPARSSTRRQPAAGRGSRRWPTVLLVLAIVAAGLVYVFRTPIAGYAGAGPAYSARVACSCRFVAGRSLDDCEKDQLAGMEPVMLSEDVDERSVTATFPLVRSDTATLRDGYGCVLDSWDG